MTDDSKITLRGVAEAIANLEASRTAHGLLNTPSKSGVYGIYLRSQGSLLPFTAEVGGLVYIGMSSNLAAREFDTHFSSTNTGFSTFRRSVGAIKKFELQLQAQPRGSGSSPRDFTSYRFHADGEQRLTSWMLENLMVGAHVSERYKLIECQLIANLRPVLNLSKWPNPHRAEIMQLRKRCADEARKARE